MKLKLEKRLDGLILTFIDEKGSSCSTYFNSPPESIDHVCEKYLSGLFWNVGSIEHVAFIKSEYKKQIQNFPMFSKAESAFEGTLLEGKKRRYTILNERDFQKYVPENLRLEFGRIFNDVLFHIESGRESENKNPYNSYVVINVDEPYIPEIVEVMKRNGHFD